VSRLPVSRHRSRLLLGVRVSAVRIPLSSRILPSRASARIGRAFSVSVDAREWPCGSSSASTHGTTDRLLPIHERYEHPCLAGSRWRRRLSPVQHRGDRLIHGQYDSLRRAAASCAAEPLMSLSPSFRRLASSRPPSERKISRDRVRCARVNGHDAGGDPRHLPSNRNSRPAVFFRITRLELRPNRGLAAADFGHSCHFASRNREASWKRGSSCSQPVAGGLRFLGSGDDLSISATYDRRTGTPDELSILAREWRRIPATRRPPKEPVALAVRMRCHTRRPASCERPRREL